MQYWIPRNQEIVRKALHLAHREDLIGFGPACLVRPAGKAQMVGKMSAKNKAVRLK